MQLYHQHDLQQLGQLSTQPPQYCLHYRFDKEDPGKKWLISLQRRTPE